MSLTTQELQRISDLENAVKRLAILMRGSGSKNQLNRLLVLAQSQIEELKKILEPMETEMKEILELVRKLQ